MAQLWIYIALAFTLFWLGGGIDIMGELDYIKVKNNNFYVFLEEVLEMLAAYTVLFGAIAFLQNRKLMKDTEKHPIVVVL